MAYDVWADRPLPSPPMHCGCGREPNKEFTCGRCRVFVYCGKRCQIDSNSEHEKDVEKCQPHPLHREWKVSDYASTDLYSFTAIKAVLSSTNWVSSIRDTHSLIAEYAKPIFMYRHDSLGLLHIVGDYFSMLCDGPFNTPAPTDNFRVEFDIDTGHMNTTDSINQVDDMLAAIRTTVMLANHLDSTFIDTFVVNTKGSVRTVRRSDPYPSSFFPISFCGPTYFHTLTSSSESGDDLSTFVLTSLTDTDRQIYTQLCDAHSKFLFKMQIRDEGVNSVCCKRWQIHGTITDRFMVNRNRYVFVVQMSITYAIVWMIERTLFDLIKEQIKNAMKIRTTPLDKRTKRKPPHH